MRADSRREVARGRSFYFDGRELTSTEPFVGAALVRASGSDVSVPGLEDPPYLFCGNGACRDCNLAIEGFPDLPSCRVPLASGMSLRSGEGAGEENALSRNAPRARVGETRTLEVVVIGAGVAGRAAAAEARRCGVNAVVLEAREMVSEEGILSRRPVAAHDGRLFVLDEGARHPIEAGAVVLANGARDEMPGFPGASLEGVLPLDLLERYVALGDVPGESILVVGEIDPKVEAALADRRVRRAPGVESVSGRSRIESARLAGGEEVSEVDFVFVRSRRIPSLSLARALGCDIVFDRARRHDRLVLGEDLATSKPGVFAAGDVADSASGQAVDSGRLAALRAAAYLRSR